MSVFCIQYFFHEVFASIVSCYWFLKFISMDLINFFQKTTGQTDSRENGSSFRLRGWIILNVDHQAGELDFMQDSLYILNHVESILPS